MKWPWRRKRVASSEEPVGVQAFNFLVVYVLGKLYGAFPAPIELKPLDETLRLVWRQFEENPETKPEDVRFPQYLTDTLRWLEVEGFIRVGSKTLDGSFHSVTLTEKAMRAMGRIPDSISPKVRERKPLGELIREASAREGVSRAGDLVKLLLASASNIT